MTKKDLVGMGLSDAAASIALNCVIAGYKAGARPNEVAVVQAIKTLQENPDHPGSQGGTFAPLIEQLKRERQEEADYVPKEPIPYKSWAPDVEEGALDQIRNSCELPMAVYAALMPDVHQGYGLPVGGVLATEGAVIPYGVGVDIACRMKLTVLDLPAKFLEPDQIFSKKGDQLAGVIEKSTRFGMGASWQKRQSHPVMDADWSVTDITKNLKNRAWDQLGTSGTGNHFVEFGLLTVTEATTDNGFRLEPDTYVALLSHSGSRGPGAEICKFYTGVAQSRLPARFAEKFKHLAWLDMETEAGQEYWKAMNLMGEYASANHSVIHENVADELGVDIVGTVENHHNFAWEEEHFGKKVYVHRKGATPAGKGVLGVIPGSMASPCFVVRGLGNPDSLMSASHGAGRCMSRNRAKQTLNHNEWKGRLRQQGVRVLSAGVDEVPAVYKSIEKVMSQQTDLVEAIARFDPKIVKMADDGKSED